SRFHGVNSHMFFLILGILFIAVVLWEAFETIILPRRVTRRFRVTRLFYLSTWRAWSKVVGRIRAKRRRETLLSIFGPSSLLFLLGIWAGGLILGFGLIQYGLGSRLTSPNEPPSWAIDVYMSGTTFFTLGLGDVTPTTWPARVVTVLE